MAERKTFLGRYVDTTQLSSIDFMKIWSYYDKDGSGYLERKELDNFLTDLMESKGKETTDDLLSEFRESVLKTIDVNKDGKIELGEFANLLPLEENFLRKFPARKTLSRQNFEDIFMHYDPDGNGFIEGKELLALIRDIVTKTDESATHQDVQDYKEAVLRVFDKNTDGRLSKKELGLLLSVEKK
jgi:Ca2+-binding EF-hand superfamily protein